MVSIPRGHGFERIASRWPERTTVSLILGGGPDPGSSRTLLEGDGLYYVSPRMPPEAELGSLLAGALGQARRRREPGPPIAEAVGAR